MSDTPTSPIPEVRNNAPKPPGILPRNTQARVLGGIALLMIVVIAFSGRQQPKERAAAPTPTAAVVDPNQTRIQEYRQRIEEQAHKLAVEQAELARTKQNLGLPSAAATSPAPAHRGRPGNSWTDDPPMSERAPATDTQRWIEADLAKREYQSLFASNVTLSFRNPPGSATESRLADASFAAPVGEAADQTTGRTRRSAEGDDFNQSEGKRYRLFEGTVIETVLTNRLDGSFSGPVNCMVTTDVHSHDRQRLLIPQGSRVLGQVRKVEGFGQQRLAVTFTRLIMPDGYSVSLDDVQGLNQLGETGLRDKVNHHYLQVFGVSLAIGAIAGLSQANTRYGDDASASDAYRQGVAGSLSQSSLRILDRYLNVLPTFTIIEGHRVKIYLSKDLLLPAYANHRMPGDL